jgi:hypothetical protein
MPGMLLDGADGDEGDIGPRTEYRMSSITSAPRFPAPSGQIPTSNPETRLLQAATGMAKLTFQAMMKSV